MTKSAVLPSLLKWGKKQHQAIATFNHIVQWEGILDLL